MKAGRRIGRKGNIHDHRDRERERGGGLREREQKNEPHKGPISITAGN